MERVHQFELHEEPLPNYTTARGDKASCTLTCRSYATELIYNVQLRLGDLERLNGWNRTSLCNGKLEDLMCMSLLEYDMNWDRVIEVWRGMKKRRPRRAHQSEVRARKSAKGKEKVVVLSEEEHDDEARADDENSCSSSGFSSSDDEEDGGNF
ncbi:hypothetical protein CLOM_g974 [Closterium sp. NIES-68]|nr:hypothetical protein CLOM_g974 [Closterium sp. NIES-68]